MASKLRPLVLLVGLTAVLLSCTREPDDLSRPWAAADLEAVTYWGATMPARRLGRDPDPLRLALGAAGPGEVLLQAALEGTANAHATIDVVDPPSAQACAVSGGPPRWQPCRLTLRHPVQDLRLHVRLDGPTDATLVISSPLVRSGSSQRPTVIVVLSDALRADCLASYTPGAPLGASLDRLAHDGVVFERVHSSSSWTRPAVATLLTGLDASTHNVLGRNDVLADGPDRLPLAMQRAGYRTLAWSTNLNIVPLWGFDSGFDFFQDMDSLAWPQVKAHAGAVLAAARAALAEPGAPPSFLYVHLMDPHAPYRPQPADLEAVHGDPRLLATFPGATQTPGALEEYARYLAEVRGMDRELGSFFEELRTLGLYDDAAILVIADHGEEFLDHGGTRHGQTLYEEVLRVPMVLKLPGNALAGTRVAGKIGMADVAPTLLGALGLASLRNPDGRNLWDAERHVFRDESAPQSAVLKVDTYHQAALVMESQKLILNYFGADRLFDLRADPRERRNLLTETENDGAMLRTILDARLARHEAGWHVRVCGGDRTLHRALRIDARGEARGVFLEAGDGVRLIARRGDNSTYEAQLELTPQEIQRIVGGRLTKSMEPDHDDVLVTAPGAETIGIAATSGEALSYALGTAAERIVAPQILARATDAGVHVRPSEIVECHPRAHDDGAASEPADDLQPYVRVWFVPPTERLSDAEVDPAIQERLRALGYQW